MYFCYVNYTVNGDAANIIISILLGHTSQGMSSVPPNKIYGKF